jgi:hypothetical protein
VVSGDEPVEGNSDRHREVTGLGGAEQTRSPQPRDEAGGRIVPEATIFARRWSVCETILMPLGLNLRFGVVVAEQVASATRW